MRDTYFDQRRATFWKPTNWLWFFVKVRFPLGLLPIAYDIYFFTVRLINGITVYQTLVIYFLVMALYEAVRLVLNIWAVAEARRLTRAGYILIKVSLYMETGMAALIGMYLQVLGSPLLGFLAGACVYGLLWLLPNISYFSQRETLFNPGYYIPTEELADWNSRRMY